jgi:hypothetical protein
MHRHECNTHNFLFNLENQTMDLSYTICPVNKNKCCKNFRIMRKLLFNYSFYSHPEIGNFRVWQLAARALPWLGGPSRPPSWLLGARFVVLKRSRSNPSPLGGLQCRAASEHQLLTRVDLRSIAHREDPSRLRDPPPAAPFQNPATSIRLHCWWAHPCDPLNILSPFVSHPSP